MSIRFYKLGGGACAAFALGTSTNTKSVFSVKIQAAVEKGMQNVAVDFLKHAGQGHSLFENFVVRRLAEDFTENARDTLIERIMTDLFCRACGLPRKSLQEHLEIYTIKAARQLFNLLKEQYKFSSEETTPARS